MVLVVLLLGMILAAGACTPGQRPTLVVPLTPTAEPELILELAPAPAGTTPLPPSANDSALQATVDDALIAWAGERNVPYVDSCTLVEPGPGELCDSPTERDTVRLLGPSINEVWYVVRVDNVTTDPGATGFRVKEVTVAGQ